MLYIQKADVSVLPGGGGRMLEPFLELFQTLRRHSDAVVIHTDEKVSIFYTRPNKQRAKASLRLQPMIA